MYAILLAVEKWMPYLQTMPFTIKTYHKSLLYLADQRANTRLQQKALLKLMDLQYSIVHKQGPTNAAADALSRHPAPDSVHAISAYTLAWLDNLIQGYQEGPSAKALMEELILSNSIVRGFSLVNGVIRHKDRIWLGSNSLAHQHVLQATHSSGVGGHSGFYATCHRVKSMFAWPKMKDTIRSYIQQCTVCQQAKVEHV